MIREEELHPIGKLTKPHGVKGEISLVTDYELADFSDNCDTAPFIVCNMDGIWTPFFIESYRKKNTTTTFVQFENLSSQESVKILSGKMAYVQSELLPPADNPPADSPIGYTIVDEQLGTIGQVISVDDSTLNVLLKVSYMNDSILIPAALVTSVQQNHQIMKVSLPEGFFSI